MTKVPASSIQIRKYRSDIDKPYIYATWLRAYKHFSYFAKRIRYHIFFKRHHDVLDKLFQKPTMQVLIACPKDDNETLLGYLAYEIDECPVVHFIHIKEEFQKMGIATALFESAAIDPNKMYFTHWTMPVNELIEKFPEMIYDPYRL